MDASPNGPSQYSDQNPRGAQPAWSCNAIGQAAEMNRKKSIHSRCVLYTDSDLYMPFDATNTLASVMLGEKWSRRFIRAIRGAFGIASGLGAVAYIILLLLARSYSDYENYLVYLLAFSWIAFPLPLLGCLLHLAKIVRQSLTHFETVFLIVNGFTSAILYGSLVNFGDMLYPFIVICVLGAMALFLMDSWIIGFSTINKNLRSYLAILTIYPAQNQSQLQFCDRTNKSGSIDVDRTRANSHAHQKENTEGIRIENALDFDPPQKALEKEERIQSYFQNSSSVRSPHVIRPHFHSASSSQLNENRPDNKVHHPYVRLIRISLLYEELLKKVPQTSGLWNKLKAIVLQSTLVGYQNIFNMVILLLVTIVSYVLIERSDVNDLQIYHVPLLYSHITTRTIFKLGCMNCIVFCCRRLAISFVIPLRVYCFSRMLIKIPLVDTLMEISASEKKNVAEIKVLSYLRIRGPRLGAIGQNKGCQTHRNYQNQFNYDSLKSMEIIAPRSMKFYQELENQNQEKSSRCQSGLLRMDSDSSAVDLGLSLDASHVPQSSQSSKDPPRIDQDIIVGSHEFDRFATLSLETKTIIFTTPLNDSIILDYDKNFLEYMLPHNSYKKFNRLIRKALNYSTVIVVVSPFLSLASICMPPGNSLYYFSVVSSILAVLERVFFMMFFSRDATKQALQSFETGFGIYNAMMGFVMSCHFLGWHRADVVFLFFFLAVICISVLLIDAYPVSFAYYNHALRREYESAMAANPPTFADIGVLAWVVDMCHMVHLHVRIQESNTPSSNGNSQVQTPIPHPRESLVSQLRPSFYERLQWSRRLFRFVGLSSWLSIFVTILWIFSFAFVVELGKLDRMYAKTFNTPLGLWDLKGLMAAGYFNTVVIMCRRLWAHSKDPLRCVCFPRRVIKIPYVQAIDDFFATHQNQIPDQYQMPNQNEMPDQCQMPNQNEMPPIPIMVEPLSALVHPEEE